MITPKTPGQAEYLDALQHATVTICTGPAGTGKTWLAAAMAASALAAKRVDRVIVTRPLIECGESMGALPGTATEKSAPFARPILDAFREHGSAVDVIPLELMRGSSFKSTWIICDEAQNATLRQLRMLLTRLGSRSRITVIGDPGQSDTTGGGLPDLIQRFDVPDIPRPIRLVRLGRDDIVRHPLIQWMDDRLA